MSLLKWCGLSFGLAGMVTLLMAFAYFMFVRGVTEFTLRFNHYCEAIPEMIMFVIGIIGIVMVMVDEYKRA